MDLVDFIHDLKRSDIPDEVWHQAKRCLLDTIGVAVGGKQTDLARIIYNHATRAFGGSETALWFDGRPVSMVGAALAHGMAIDALDMHDSCRPVKGHAGVAQVPAALATVGLDPTGDISGEELITTLVMAYDVSIRAGTALHATACDYHTSGAWNSLGTAAIVARRLGLSREQTRHALGIAEYHGPRSQMMRCIDYPTMVKDGSGWGAMAGVSAGLMAADGFTGAPAITVEGDDVAQYFASLGKEWSLMIQFFKPYAVCYWAQPSIAGALQIQSEHNVPVDQIAAIRVHAFHEATRLAMRHPADTEQAQYSLPYPVAAALVHHKLGLHELSGDALTDPVILRLADMVELVDDDEYNAQFPQDRLGRVIIETTDGKSHDSGTMRAKWTEAPADQELTDKFRELAHDALPADRADALEAALWDADNLDSTATLADLLTPAF